MVKAWLIDLPVIFIFIFLLLVVIEMTITGQYKQELVHDRELLEGLILFCIILYIPIINVFALLYIIKKFIDVIT